MDLYEILPTLLLSGAFLFLLISALLTAMGSALRQLQHRELKKYLQASAPLFFYRTLHLYFFPKKEFEGLLLATNCCQSIVRFGYAATFVSFLLDTQQFASSVVLLPLIGFILAAFVFADFLPRLAGMRYPQKALLFSAPIVSLFMLLAFPITYFILRIFLSSSAGRYGFDLQEPEAQVTQEIMEIIHEAKVSSSLDAHEKKLIESVVSFRNRIAREVMVPRVDLFSLPVEISIRDAARLLEEEGYSRTPVYRQNIDNIIGVLMYKDIVKQYRDYEQKGQDASILDASIETIVKNVLYTPETKKISQLLQEFRKKQVHLAIVVDEYGGTEGLVTIEDILEEIVGEIADEYDEKEALYAPLADGGWIVDARMSILDADELLGVAIPQEGEYDTIGGYIFHQTGSIPPKGVVIHHDTFDLEILISNDRCVEKVRIKPLSSGQKDEANPLP